MLITIDTNENTAEVLNEDTKDWERAYIKSLTYDVAYDSVPCLMGSIDIPTHVAHTLDFEMALPTKR